MELDSFFVWAKFLISITTPGHNTLAKQKKIHLENSDEAKMPGKSQSKSVPYFLFRTAKKANSLTYHVDAVSRVRVYGMYTLTSTSASPFTLPSSPEIIRVSTTTAINKSLADPFCPVKIPPLNGCSTRTSGFGKVTNRAPSCWKRTKKKRTNV